MHSVEALISLRVFAVTQLNLGSVKVKGSVISGSCQPRLGNRADRRNPMEWVYF